MFQFLFVLFLQHAVPVGYSEMSIMKRNDAESLIVRPGCKFVGESKLLLGQKQSTMGEIRGAPSSYKIFCLRLRL